ESGRAIGLHEGGKCRAEFFRGERQRQRWFGPIRRRELLHRGFQPGFAGKIIAMREHEKCRVLQGEQFFRAAGNGVNDRRDGKTHLWRGWRTADPKEQADLRRENDRDRHPQPGPQTPCFVSRCIRPAFSASICRRGSHGLDCPAPGESKTLGSVASNTWAPAWWARMVRWINFSSVTSLSACTTSVIGLSRFRAVE